jgi:ankyrin repeat protein
LLLVAALVACRGGAPTPPLPKGDVQLSYEVRDAWVGPSFRVTFFDNGIVEFEGIRNCGVPGQHRMRFPSSHFERLRTAFQRANFFNISRLDSSPGGCVDCNVVIVAYRDSQRVHETVDDSRHLARLTRLEQELREAARIVDGFIHPTVEVYQRLLADGWNPSFPDEAGENALTTALGRNPAAALFLLERGAEATRQALQLAALGDADTFWKVAKSRRLDLASAEARELLVQSAGRSTAVMRSLLASGLDPNGASGERRPIDAAVGSGSHERVQALLAAGADPRVSKHVMFVAVDQDDSGMIALMARHGANVDVRDPTGRTPLFVASDSCKYWHVEPLLQAGADPTLSDDRGRSVLRPQTAYGEPKPTEGCRKTLALLADAVKKRQAVR